jgi:hypothetical protein
MEEAYGLARLCRLGGQRGFRLSSSREEIPLVASYSAALYRMFMLADDLEAHRRCIDEDQALTRRPCHLIADSRIRRIAAADRGQERLKTPSGYVCPVTSWIALTTHHEAQHRIARLALAMHVYRACHGQFPEDPEDLVPQFISEVPRDPFDGDALKLKRCEHGSVIYSIGANMTDDGGVRTIYPWPSGDITFQVSKTSIHNSQRKGGGVP